MKKFLTIVGAIVVAFFIITLIIGLVAGTSTNEPTQAEVRVRTGSSTCWSGQIDDATKEGCGERTYTVSNDLGIIVAVVQKKSDDQIGLTVEVWIDGKLADTATTNAAYGVVTVSATD
jgi:hypothetical protein